MPIAIREGQAIVFLFIVCQPSFVSYLLFLYFKNLIVKIDLFEKNKALSQLFCLNLECSHIPQRKQEGMKSQL